MRWPWQARAAQLSAASATDQLLVRLLLAARGASTYRDALQTAAVETCAGLWARALASADLSGGNFATQAIRPETLALIGRELIRSGSLAFAIDVAGGRVALRPAAAFEVAGGGTDPRAWVYRLTFNTPSGQSRTRYAPADGVCVFRWAVDAREPWAGRSPLQSAQETARMAGGAERGLASESSSPSGYVVPTPAQRRTDEAADVSDDMKSLVATLSGGTELVPSADAGDWTNPTTGSVHASNDWKAQRIGANPPQAFTELRKDALQDVVSACGVPGDLFHGGEGAAAREAGRRFLAASVLPIARQVTLEFAEKLDAPGLRLTFRDLAVSDLQIKSRAAGTLGKLEGIDAAQALELAMLA